MNILYLLWGLLNIVLFVFFIVTCFKASKFLKEKIGLLAAIVFVFGLLSFVTTSGNDEENLATDKNERKKWKFATDDKIEINSIQTISVVLERTIMSQYQLGIQYGKTSDQILPVQAYSLTTGLISGTNWKPVSIDVNTSGDDKTLQYFVIGVIEWKLLGATIYSQPKSFSGTVKGE
jgi:hypothetical protein